MYTYKPPGWLVYVGGTVMFVSLLLINHLIPRGKIILEEQMDIQLVNKFAACDGTRELITLFTALRH